MSAGEAVQAAPARRSLRPLRFGLTITAVLALLFGVPWWALVLAGMRWPKGLVVAATTVFVCALIAFPVLMYVGHGRRHLDWAARTGDTILGVTWVMFVWALLGNVLGLAIGDQLRPGRPYRDAVSPPRAATRHTRRRNCVRRSPGEWVDPLRARRRDHLYSIIVSRPLARPRTS